MGKVLLLLFAVSVGIFFLGILGCIFWLGVAALGLFLKIMLPIILIIAIITIVAALINII